jgi:hypothetical protein
MIWPSALDPKAAAHLTLGGLQRGRSAPNANRGGGDALTAIA